NAIVLGKLVITWPPLPGSLARAGTWIERRTAAAQAAANGDRRAALDILTPPIGCTACAAFGTSPRWTGARSRYRWPSHDRHGPRHPRNPRACPRPARRPRAFDPAGP